MRHRLPGLLVGLAASLRSMPTACCEDSHILIRRSEQWSQAEGWAAGKEIIQGGGIDFGLRITDYGLRITDYGLRITDYGLWIMDYGLWIMDYGLWIMDWKRAI
jgi:hypothetical protein